MTRIREAILVEGRYDVNTVRQVVDTVVLESGGFRIFNNKDQLKLLRRIAETRGLIVLTDSDGAGFVIRNYLKGALPKGRRMCPISRARNAASGTAPRRVSWVWRACVRR